MAPPRKSERLRFNNLCAYAAYAAILCWTSIFIGLRCLEGRGGESRFVCNCTHHHHHHQTLPQQQQQQHPGRLREQSALGSLFAPLEGDRVSSADSSATSGIGHLRVLVMLHSTELWAAKGQQAADAAAVLPSSLLVEGVHHDLTVVRGYDPDLLAAADAEGDTHLVMLLNSGMALLGDGETMQASQRAGRPPGGTSAELVVSNLLRALHRGALAAGCTAVAGNAIASSGYEAFAVNGSLDIAPRMEGAPVGYRPASGSGEPAAPVALLSADCLAFWRAHPSEWRQGPLQKLYGRHSRANAERGDPAKPGSLQEADALEDDDRSPRAYHAVHRGGWGLDAERFTGSLLREFLFAERNATEAAVLEHGAFQSLATLMGVLKGHRNAFLAIRTLLNKQAPGPDHFALSQKVDASIALLGSHLLVGQKRQETADPVTWGFRRAFVPSKAVGSSVSAVLPHVRARDYARATEELRTATSRMEAEFADLIKTVGTVQVKDWVQIGWHFSALVLRLDSTLRVAAAGPVGRGVAVSPLVVPGGAIVSYTVPVVAGAKVVQHTEPFPKPSTMVETTLSASGLLSGEVNPPTWFLRRVVVVWLLPCCMCCGFVSEAVSLIQGLFALDADVRLATPTDNCLCDSFSQSTRRFLNSRRVSGSEVEQLAADRQKKVILILHGVPIDFETMLGKAGIANTTSMILVGRAMYEFTRIPPEFPEVLNRRVDEVWVPSAFVKTVFRANGVEKPVVVVGESVDVQTFHPYPSQHVDCPPAEVPKSEVLSYGAARGPTDFQFLSMFKWEFRKGWDVLIGAYLRAFTNKDNVSLCIASIPHQGPLAERDRITADLETIISSMATQGYNVGALPSLTIVHSKLPEKVVPGLFSGSDAFVLPTRGEGWGLPIMQALASGLPTIATPWSGPADFLTETNAYHLQFQEEEILPGNYYGYAPGKRWAQPNGTHLIQLFKRVRYNTREAAHIGGNAAREMRKRYNIIAVAKAWLKEVRRLAFYITKP